MKYLEPHNSKHTTIDKEKIANQRVIVNKSHLHTERIKKNHILFEYSITDQTLVKYDWEQNADGNIDNDTAVINEDMTISLKRQVVVKEDHIYISCLNRKNAIKKLEKKGYPVIDK